MSKETRGNAVREAIKAAAESGNRRMIQEEDFTDVGGTVGDFLDYDRVMTTIENLARKWCYLKFNENEGEHDKEIEEIESNIMNHEKTLYAWIRTEETKAFFHAAPNDGAYIASLADSFMAVKNNTEGATGFTSPKAHAPVKHSVFRKALENHLGTKVLKLNTISPEHAEFLRQERKLLSAVKRAGKVREEQKEILASYNKDLAQAKSEDVKEHIRGKIRGIEKLIENSDKEIEKAERKVAKIQADYPDEVMHEDTLEEIREAKKRAKEEREARKKAKEENSTAKKLEVSRGIAISKLTREQMILEITEAGISFPEKAKRSELKPLVKQARGQAA